MSVPQPPVDGIPQPPEGTRISPESASSYQKLQTETSEAARAYNVYQAERGEYERQKAVLEREGLLRKNKVYIRSDRDRVWHQKLQEQGSRVNVAAERYEKEVSDYESLKSQFKQVGLIKDDQFIFNLENITPKISIVKAGPTIKTSDYPSPQATQPTAQSSGVERQLKQAIDENPLFLGLVAKPAVDAFSGVLSGITYPWDTSSAQSKYEGAVNAYGKKYTEAEKAGLIVNGEFLIANPTAELRYKEIQIAADAVNRSEKELKETQKQELFGIPDRFHDIEKGLASTLNLPPLSPDQARTITKLQNPGTLLASHLTGYQNPVTEIQAGVLSGAYSGVRDRPLTGAASFGVGLVGGLAVKGATKIPMIGQAVGKALPPTLKLAEGAWVGSIGARTVTSPDLFSAGETLGGILTTEALPVAAGAGAALHVPGKISAPYLARGFDMGIPRGTPPPQQMVFDLTGEIAPPRHIATTGQLKVFGTEADFPQIRDIARTGGVQIHGTEADFPSLREVARAGESKIHGTEADFPNIREIADVGGVKVFGTEADFPVIRELGRDAAGVRVFDTTGLAEPELVGVVNTAPSRGPGSRRGVEVLYSPEALGARQRTIMNQQKAARPLTPKGSQQLIRPSTPQKAVITPVKIQIPDIRITSGVPLNVATITKSLSRQTSQQGRGEIRETLPETLQETLPERSDTKFFKTKIDVLPKVDQTTIPDVRVKTAQIQETSLKSDQESMRITMPISKIDIQTRSKIEQTPKVRTDSIFEPPQRPILPIRFDSDEKTKKKRKRDPGDVLAWEVRNKVPKMEDIFGPTKPSKRSRSATTTNMADTAAEIRRITAINPYKSNKKGNKRR